MLHNVQHSVVFYVIDTLDVAGNVVTSEQRRRNKKINFQNFTINRIKLIVERGVNDLIIALVCY